MPIPGNRTRSDPAGSVFISVHKCPSVVPTKPVPPALRPFPTMPMSPLDEIRHSASHILATAILRVFPDAKLDIGPPTETGFYYDIDLDHKLTNDDLAKLEVEMKKVIEENQPFRRKE